jgi:hypothetical protein
MTPTVNGSDRRPMPRFTFAGRGCRDSRREPRAPVCHSVLHDPPHRRQRRSPPTSRALRYGPGPWQIPMSLWWSNGAAMPS